MGVLKTRNLDSLEMTWSVLIIEISTNIADSSSFRDAKEPLLKAALIDRSSEAESLTMHRLV